MKNTEIENEVFTRPEAAKHLRISIRKLDMMIDAKEIKSLRIGSSVRITKRALDSFIVENESE